MHSLTITNSLLTKIFASNVERIFCDYSDDLENINAPDAKILRCTQSPELTNIEAPNAEQLDVSSCIALEKIHAPNAKDIKGEYCTALTQIYAPNARNIDVRETPNLKILYAPKAKNLSLSKSQLKTLFAPEVKYLYIQKNTTLEFIYAPKAILIRCNDCIKLSIIYAPKLRYLYSENIPLTAKKTAIQSYYNRLITKKNHKKNLFNKLKDLFKKADLILECEQIDTFNGKIRIYVWLRHMSNLAIPLRFQTSEQQRTLNIQIENSFKKLKSLAQEEMNISDIDLKWFNDIYGKINNPQYKIKTIIWLGELLIRSSGLKKTPFLDEFAITTLKAIALTTNYNTQTNATLSLVSLYSPDNKDLYELWKSNIKNLKFYQLLPYLLLIHVKIDNKLKSLWINNLAPRYYQSLDKISPIIEMISLVTQEKLLFIKDCQSILNLILNTPLKNREPTTVFRKRLNEFRTNQAIATKAVRDLILIKKFAKLQHLQNVNELLLKYKKTFMEMFGLKEENIEKFLTTFESIRYPDGLFIYAAGLHYLEDSRKNESVKQLGLFVNDVIEGTFPNCRYNLRNNEHLNAIFGNNQELLNKWRSPCKIKLKNDQDLNLQSTTPSGLVKKLIKQAINDEHLGKNQKTLYPTLSLLVDEENIETIESSIRKLTNERSGLQNQIQSAEPTQKLILQNLLNQLSIEISCLNLIILDENVPTDSVLESLQKLIKLLQKGSQFESDIDDIVEYITPSDPSKLKYLSIEDSDYWEDLLLMGTEVKSSCQKVDGDPSFNIGLVATLIDGKNRLVIVRDCEGKIAARVILRIMLDNNNEPVLFMERLYIRYNDPRLEKFVLRGCIKKAKMMNVSLFAGAEWLGNIENKTPYPLVLTTLNGPASYEYSDAAGGMQKNGNYSIFKSWIVFEKTM